MSKLPSMPAHALHFVYIIAKQSEKKCVSPVKVGITKSIANRIVTIQTSCPFEIDLLRAYRFPLRQTARWFEDNFHYTMGVRRLRGEWFDVTPDEATDWMHSSFWHFCSWNNETPDLEEIERSWKWVCDWRSKE